MADPGFFVKLGIELGIGLVCKITAEAQKRGESFKSELDFVFANVVRCGTVFLQSAPWTRPIYVLSMLERPVVSLQFLASTEVFSSETVRYHAARRPAALATPLCGRPVLWTSLSARVWCRSWR